MSAKSSQTFQPSESKQLPDSCEVRVDIKHLYMRYASIYREGAKMVMEETINHFEEIFKDEKNPKIDLARFFCSLNNLLQKKAAKKYCSLK